jgi:hypothetical protein
MLQSFEVESATTARHLMSVITEKIGLKYPSGCGLFFKIGDKGTIKIHPSGVLNIGYTASFS